MAGNVRAVAMLCAVLCGVSGAGRLVKRADDQDPLQAVVQQLAARLEDLEARLTSEVTARTAAEARLARLETHVAFSVQYAALSLNAPASGPYKFNRVLFNDGQAYDPVLGVFTAPVSGVYTFATQVFTHSVERPVTDIVVNGSIAARMAVYADSSASRSHEISGMTSALVQLSAGDRVWVQNGYSQAMDIFGQHHTFFAGALLYAS